MTKEVTKKEETAVSTQVNVEGPEILSGDLVLEQIILMQGTSDLIKEGRAKLGDIVKSISAKKYGDMEVEVKFIPLTFKNLWLNKEMISKRGEFRGWEARTGKNDDLPWDYKVEGSDIPWTRTKVIQVYALLESDIEAQIEAKKIVEGGGIPDLSATLLPVVINFQRTSYKAGCNITTHFGNSKQAKKVYGIEVPAHSYLVNLGCKTDKNDEGEYFVYTTKVGEKVDGDVLALATEWVNTLGISKVEVHQGDEQKSKPSEADIGNNDQF